MHKSSCYGITPIHTHTQWQNNLKTDESRRSLIHIKTSHVITPLGITPVWLTALLSVKRPVLTSLFPLLISFLTSSIENPPMLSLSEGDVTRAEEKSCKGHLVRCGSCSTGGTLMSKRVTHFSFERKYTTYGEVTKYKYIINKYHFSLINRNVNQMPFHFIFREIQIFFHL